MPPSSLPKRVEVARDDKTDAWVLQVMYSEEVILAAAIWLLPRSSSRGVHPPLTNVLLPRPR
jgi:hypothetical protein